MSRRLLSFAGGIAILFTASGLTRAQDAQDSPPTAQTPGATKNPEADWTIVEFPEGREVVVEFKPTEMLPGAGGTAKVTRGSDETIITLDVSGLGDGGGYHLYAVSHEGQVVPLGAVETTEGSGTLGARTNLNRFMLVLSPDPGLTTVGDPTRVALRSAVPDGLTVVPRAGGAATEEAASNTDAAAEVGDPNARAEDMAAGDNAEYDVPLLGVTSLRRGAETQLKSHLSGDLAGTRTAVFVKPLKGGATQVKVRFQNLKEPENGARFVLWAVAPDKTYTRLGEADKPDRRGAAKIDARTLLRDFGLFITAEVDVAAPLPTGPAVAMLVR
ncbi:MAG: hypothetical protein M3430_17185 [Acidobacteriota bacterium]|nr:hypothetical protein [Acidobacteriota bacterium]